MSLTPVEIAADAVAVCLAGSKMLSAVQPLWAKLPSWLGVLIPVLVADLPLIGAAFGVVTTTQDLLTAAITSVALLVPGIAAAEAPKAA